MRGKTCVSTDITEYAFTDSCSCAIRKKFVSAPSFHDFVKSQKTPSHLADFAIVGFPAVVARATMAKSAATTAEMEEGLGG